MTGIKVKAVNLKQWKAQANDVASYMNGRELARIMETMLSQRLYALEERQFKSEGGSGASGKWAPLSARYIARKAALGGDGILVLTGRMRGSLTGPGGENVSRANNRATGFEYQFGTLDEKAPYHQKGTSNLPKRPPIDLTDQQINGIGIAMARTMEDGLFSRMWFEKRGANRRISKAKFTGFNQKRIP